MQAMSAFAKKTFKEVSNFKSNKYIYIYIQEMNLE